MVYKDTDSNYAKQVTAEQKITVKKDGTLKSHWELKTSHADNHYLDCEVYAMVAAEMCGVRSLHLQTPEPEAPKVQETQQASSDNDSGWMSGVSDNWMEGG